MPLVLFHTRRVREALKMPSGLLADAAFLAIAACAIGLVLLMAQQAWKPFHGDDPARKVIISLSFLALPKYTLLSLSRGFAAYVLSLTFTLIYGTFAAHNARAEKIMIPALDVLQAIPVLGFLPGLVLAMIHLFPTREIGLEIACVVMIFTAQVWNMTFSFHGSLRGIPQPLREVAAIQRLSGWQTFKLLEVPAAMIGLVWNSMMSMAGGWFFLTVNEAFTLNGRDYRLPGIGSYMNEAILHFEPGVLSSWGPILGAIVAMVVMIVAVDQVFWRPIVVWSQRYRMDDIAQADSAQSWMLDLLQKSRIYARLNELFAKRHAEPAAVSANPSAPANVLSPAPAPALVGAGSESGAERVKVDAGRAGFVFAPVLKWLLLALLAIGALWGAWAIIRLLVGLPLWDAEASRAGKSIVEHADWVAVVLALLASFVRTSVAVILGAAWALPVGILIGRSHKWSSRLQPIIQVVASFPAPMLFPLVTMALLVLHIPFTTGCVALMLLGAQWYILFNVIAGASAIPHDLDEVGEVYQMSRWERWKKLYLPCTFPYLLTGLVTAAGGAWNATIVSEYVQLNNRTFMAFGLGSTISRATENGNFSQLAAGVVVMAFFVVLVNRFFWKRLYRLAEDRYSLNV